MTNFVLVEPTDARSDSLTEAEFFALYPLYRLAEQRAKNGNPDFDYSMSRDDFMNGKNGIPVQAGMKIVFTLLGITGRYVDISPDQQSFRINERGAKAVHSFAKSRKS